MTHDRFPEDSYDETYGSLGKEKVELLKAERKAEEELSTLSRVTFDTNTLHSKEAFIRLQEMLLNYHDEVYMPRMRRARGEDKTSSYHLDSTREALSTPEGRDALYKEYVAWYERQKEKRGADEQS